MQPSDQFGGLNVHRVLIAEGPALYAEDEAKRLYVVRQVLECKGDSLTLIQVVQLETLEVADQDVARSLTLLQGVEIVPGLIISPGQIASGAFLLDDQNTRARTGR